MRRGGIGYEIGEEIRMAWNQIGNGASGNHSKHSPNSGPLDKAEQMSILADRLFSFYHGQELAADPEVFLAGVVELFCRYPHEIVLRAVSPVFGLPKTHKFPPRISEIYEFLEAEMGPTRREEERQSRRLCLPEPPVDRTKRLSYEELKAKYGENWGIKPEKAKAKWQPPSADELRDLIGQEEWDKIPSRA